MFETASNTASYSRKMISPRQWYQLHHFFFKRKTLPSPGCQLHHLLCYNMTSQAEELMLRGVFFFSNPSMHPAMRSLPWEMKVELFCPQQRRKTKKAHYVYIETLCMCVQEWNVAGGWLEIVVCRPQMQTVWTDYYSVWGLQRPSSLWVFLWNWATHLPFREARIAQW